jgi:hypothetical protein
MPPVASLLVRVWVGTEKKQFSRNRGQVNDEGGGAYEIAVGCGIKRLNRKQEKVEFICERREEEKIFILTMVRYNE